MNLPARCVLGAAQARSAKSDREVWAMKLSARNLMFPCMRMMHITKLQVTCNCGNEQGGSPPGHSYSGQLTHLHALARRLL